MHVSFPPYSLFYVMGAINKESIWRSAVQLVAKRSHVETTDATPTPRPSSSSTPSCFSRVDVSLVDIMDQLQHMRVDFGSRLDHLSDEMCQMNTKIGRITRLQTCLGGFALSPTPKPIEESSSDGGDDDDDDDAFGFETDDEMAASQ